MSFVRGIKRLFLRTDGESNSRIWKRLADEEGLAECTIRDRLAFASVVGLKLLDQCEDHPLLDTTKSIRALFHLPSYEARLEYIAMMKLLREVQIANGRPKTRGRGRPRKYELHL